MKAFSQLLIDAKEKEEMEVAFSYFPLCATHSNYHSHFDGHAQLFFAKVEDMTTLVTALP